MRREILMKKLNFMTEEAVSKIPLQGDLS